MHPERLTSIPPAQLEAILRTNFDRRSLANHLGGHNACCHVYATAVQLWCRDGRFRLCISRLLNSRHQAALETTRSTDIDMLRAYALQADYCQHPDIGGLMWALQSDPRPPIEACLPMLLHRIQNDALHALSAIRRPGKHVMSH